MYEIFDLLNHFWREINIGFVKVSVYVGTCNSCFCQMDVVWCTTFTCTYTGIVAGVKISYRCSTTSVIYTIIHVYKDQIKTTLTNRLFWSTSLICAKL